MITTVTVLIVLARRSRCRQPWRAPRHRRRRVPRAVSQRRPRPGPINEAVAVSLMTVIATSSAVSAGTAGRQLINLRLGMLLEIASAIGGRSARNHRRAWISEPRSMLRSPSSTALIAIMMFTRLERRNVIVDGVVVPACSAAGISTMRAAARSSIGSSGCRSACSGLLRSQDVSADARDRRRDPESAGAQRLVWRADARRGRDQRH